MDGGLILRAFEKSDAAALHQLLNEPALLERRYLDDEEDGDPLSLVQVEDLLEKWTKSGGRTHRAVTDGDDLLGIGSLDSSWDPLAPFMSVVIGTAYQRRGLGTKTLDLLLQHQFGTSPSLAVQTWVDTWNESGLAFARTYGFREAGSIRREGIRNGTYFDAVGFDMTRGEWEARHGH
ncbi:MAG: GNAT family N-acetyltransferase [Acidimicrobiia bacterium]